MISHLGEVLVRGRDIYLPTWTVFCNASRDALSSRSSRLPRKKPDRSPRAPHIEQLSIRLSFQLIFFASDAKDHQTRRRLTLLNSLSLQNFCINTVQQHSDEFLEMWNVKLERGILIEFRSYHFLIIEGFLN